MSGPDRGGDPPPEVPEEFAAAYREAYRRTLDRDGSPGSGAPPALGAGHAREYVVPSRWEELRGRRWFVPALLAAIAVLLVLGAYVLGRVLSGGAAEGDSSTAAGRSERAAWRGDVSPVTPSAASAACTARPGVDASGRTVTYQVANVLDRDPRTAWRCDGTAVGQRLVLRLPAPTDVGEVGLIPGYAKTDAKSHADRYAQNNRITEVRWTLGGTTVVQKMSGSATDRSMRTVRVPRTRTSTITLEILSVHRGPRDTTAISGVLVGAAG